MELEPLLVLLRSHGVARYEADGICVSFHEAVPPRLPANAAVPEAPPDEDLCTCGHPILTDHMPTGCVHGCAIETCGVPTGKAPPDA